MISSKALVVTGGTFTRHHHHDQRQYYNVHSAKGGFELLKDAVSPAAFHNSGERFDPPKCHPNTRVAVLKKIMDWITGCDPETRDALIMWLSGSAGAGKSAIAQSIAELCYSEGRLLASFFFGRSDPTRNHAGSLVATISYQVCRTIPTIRDHITLAIENDPLIFTQSLITQFTSLVVNPLRDLFNSGYFNNPDSPRVILIDGLDECLDRRVQTNILDAISHAIRQLHAPFLFLIVSRPDHDILAGFDSTAMRGMLTRVILNDSHHPDADIELFLRDEFNNIKETHPFKQSIPSPWPTDKVLSELVRKSSRQFIYASTVIKYVKSSRHRPAHRLDIVLNIRPAHKDLPFVELDALYTHILSSVEDIEPVFNILSFMILSRKNYFYSSSIEEILSLDPGETQLLVCDLGSIVAFHKGADGSYHIQILHASLTDFLIDESRSRKFYINLPMKRPEILRRCFQILTYCSFTVDSVSRTHRVAMFFILVHLEIAPIADVRDAILEFSITRIYKEASGVTEGAQAARSLIPYFNLLFLPAFFKSLKNLGKNADDLLAHHSHSFDHVLTQQLDIYYSSIPLTLLIALIDFCIMKQKQIQLIFSWEFSLFEMESDLSDIEESNLSLTDLQGYGARHYAQLVYDFLHDPTRSVKCGLDGQRYATAAVCCLMYLCDDHSAPHMGLRFSRHTKHDNGIRRNTPWIWLRRIDRRKKVIIWRKKRSDDVHHSAGGPPFSDDNLKNPAVHQGIWSGKYALGLEYLLYFLPRSSRSEELIEFCNRHTFAPRARESPKQMKRVRRSIAEYLERVGSGEE